MLAIAAFSLAACSGDEGEVDAGGASVPTSSGPAPVVESAPDATDGDSDTDDPEAELDFPEILMVEPSLGDNGLWTIAVTIASPYDTPEQYADGWRVMGPDGTVYGVHTLGHDHANEQPFTRTQLNVEIPDEVTEVTVEGRDLVNGFGGPTLTVELDRG